MTTINQSDVNLSDLNAAESYVTDDFTGHRVAREFSDFLRSLARDDELIGHMEDRELSDAEFLGDQVIGHHETLCFSDLGGDDISDYDDEHDDPRLSDALDGCPFDMDELLDEDQIH